MTPALLQRIWPFVAAIVVTAGVTFVVVQCRNEPFPIAVPAATMTFGIVVSGFVATQRNMLLTMSGAAVLRFAARTGYYQAVLAYLMDCIRAGLLVTVISLAGFLLGKNDLLWAIWLPLLAGSITLVICSIVRSEMLVARMVRRFIEEQGSPTQGTSPPANPR